MFHGEGCACSACREEILKDIVPGGEDAYKCENCGSQSQEVAGECCGETRERKCAQCGHLHQKHSRCACGCEI